MSFIRCTSNVEGLYIWHDVGNYIAVTHCKAPPFASQDGFVDLQFHIPLKEWYGLFANIERYYYGSVLCLKKTKYKDFSIEECYISSITGEQCDIYDLMRKQGEYERLKPITQIKISYGQHFVYVFPVTLQHVTYNVIRDLQRRRRKK